MLAAVAVEPVHRREDLGDHQEAQRHQRLDQQRVEVVERSVVQTVEGDERDEVQRREREHLRIVRGVGEGQASRSGVKVRRQGQAYGYGSKLGVKG